MRKRLIDTTSPAAAPQFDWLNLAAGAQVEISSEDPDHPIEAALIADSNTGWRAAQAGPQTIRIIFDEPHNLHHIQLQFDETAQARTQEFVLSWASKNDVHAREIVRQQWNFNPLTAATEREEYQIELRDVLMLELKIIPDMSGGDTPATLTKLRVA